MIEGKDAKKSNWLPFVVVVIAAVVLIFASGGDSENTGPSEDHSDGEAAMEDGAMSEEDGTTEEGDKMEVGLEGKKKIVIAEDFASWTENATVSDATTVSRSLSVSGDVEEALLYVDASVDGEPLASFHSFYFKLVNSGGHLFRPDSLDAGKGEGTTLLFDLSKLPYLPSVPYSEDRDPDVMDLTLLLADGTRPLVTSFISSLDEGAIHELSIHYSCAADSDCDISLN